MTLNLRFSESTALFLALMAVGGCNDDSAKVAESIRPALVAMVDRQTTDVFGPFAGTVAPRYESTQGFRASGRIITRDVNVGDLIAKGQKLASLDETILRFGVVQSEADVLNAEAQLRKTQAAERRKRNLITTGAVPQSDVDSAEADRKTAAAKLDQAKAALVKSNDQLGYANLLAEYGGVVTAWKAEVGQYVGQGQNVVTIARLDVREAVVDIPDGLVDEVKSKDVYDVRLAANEGEVSKGIVREIAPSSDSATRTRRVRLTLQNPSIAFRLGSTISLSLQRAVTPRIRVPENAIFESGSKTAVWIIPFNKDEVSLREVHVMSQATGIVTVSGRLQVGDRVVIAGTHRLKEGQKVTPVTNFP